MGNYVLNAEPGVIVSGKKPLDGLKIYIAAPWIHLEDARAASIKVEALGGEITEKWWEHENVGVYPARAEGEDLANLQSQAQADIAGVLSADVMIVLQLAKSEGKAVEQGIGLMRGLPTLVVSPKGERGHLFHYLLDDASFHETIDQALDQLVRFIKEFQDGSDRGEDDGSRNRGTEGVEVSTIRPDALGQPVGSC